MWRLLNKWFGFQYVVAQWGYDHVVKRVRKAPNGKLYVSFYDEIYWLMPDGNLRNAVTDKARKYSPLTWSAEKDGD